MTALLEPSFLKQITMFYRVGLFYFDNKILKIDCENNRDLKNRAYKLKICTNEAKYGLRYKFCS